MRQVAHSLPLLMPGKCDAVKELTALLALDKIAVWCSSQFFQKRIKRTYPANELKHEQNYGHMYLVAYSRPFLFRLVYPCSHRPCIPSCSFRFFSSPFAEDLTLDDKGYLSGWRESDFGSIERGHTDGKTR